LILLYLNYLLCTWSLLCKCQFDCSHFVMFLRCLHLHYVMLILCWLMFAVEVLYLTLLSCIQDWLYTVVVICNTWCCFCRVWCWTMKENVIFCIISVHNLHCIFFGITQLVFYPGSIFMMRLLRQLWRGFMCNKIK